MRLPVLSQGDAKVERVGGLRVLAEDHDADLRPVLPEPGSSLDALAGAGGRHPDVGHHHVGILLGDDSKQLRQVAGHAGQLEILAEMAQGKNNAAIAAALTVTERAVEKHTNSIFAKLGLSEEKDVNRRVKAVLLYLSQAESG